MRATKEKIQESIVHAQSKSATGFPRSSYSESSISRYCLRGFGQSDNAHLGEMACITGLLSGPLVSILASVCRFYSRITKFWDGSFKFDFDSVVFELSLLRRVSVHVSTKILDISKLA